jgi:hypothetical protein
MGPFMVSALLPESGFHLHTCNFGRFVILTTYLYFLLRPPVEIQAFFGFNDVVLYSTDSGSIIIEISC